MRLDLDVILPSLIAAGIILLVSFPVHEFAHAWAAYRLGDGTAKLFGRLTLNPIVHFDPLGGFLLLVSSLIGRSGSAGRSRRRSTRSTCAAAAGARGWSRRRVRSRTWCLPSFGGILFRPVCRQLQRRNGHPDYYLLQVLAGLRA